MNVPKALEEATSTTLEECVLVVKRCEHLLSEEHKRLYHYTERFMRGLVHRATLSVLKGIAETEALDWPPVGGLKEAITAANKAAEHLAQAAIAPLCGPFVDDGRAAALRYTQEALRAAATSQGPWVFTPVGGSLQSFA